MYIAYIGKIRRIRCAKNTLVIIWEAETGSFYPKRKGENLFISTGRIDSG
jgi:hypothetical protein